eukprot:2502872-Prymnesium_polylepis.1
MARERSRYDTSDARRLAARRGSSSLSPERAGLKSDVTGVGAPVVGVAGCDSPTRGVVRVAAACVRASPHSRRAARERWTRER